MSAQKDRNVASAAAAAAADLADARSASPSSAAGGTEPFVRSVEGYQNWKNNLPILYDAFIHSNLEWPSYACAWGAVIPEREATATNAAATAAAAAAAAPTQPSTPGTPTSAAGSANTAPPCLTGSALTPRVYPTSYVTQTLFLSRSTDSRLEKDKWIGSPNMLLKAEIYYPNPYRTQDIGKMQNFDEDQRNPALIVRKKIIHPGEINRIKVVPQYPDIIATHTDSPLVYVWNTNTQPGRRSQLNLEPSVPDLTLQGHEERAECNTLYFALDCSKHNALVISGGSDQKICMWSIQDYATSLVTTAHVGAAAVASTAGTTLSSPRAPPAPKKHIERLLSPRMIFSGHTAQVEEVSFHPNHQDLLCSVGDDQMLMIWDMRLGGARPAIRLHTGHSDDVNAVHWNTVNDNLLLTGSSDHSVKLIDLRRVAQADSFTRRYEANSAALCAQAAAAGDQGRGAVVHTFRGHAGNVTNVQWHSDGQHFASGSDDGDLCVWSIRGVDALQRQAFPSASASAAATAMDTDDLAASRIGDSGLPPKPLWDGSADGQPEHLLFRHSGHRTAVVSFAWNPFVLDGWTMASLSDDSADETLVGGGRLHVWRMTDLLHKDFNLTAAEFNAGQSPSGQTPTAAQPAASPSPSPQSSSPNPADGTPQSENSGANADAAASEAADTADAAVDVTSSIDMPPPDLEHNSDDGEAAPMNLDD